MYSNELVKGTLKTLVMRLLQDRERMYGYEITQQVKLLTDGKIVMTEGALYPLLHKLEAEGALTTEVEEIGKRVRKYYRLTPSGEQRSSEMAEEFMDFMATMRRIMEPKNQPDHGTAQ